MCSEVWLLGSNFYLFSITPQFRQNSALRSFLRWLYFCSTLFYPEGRLGSTFYSHLSRTVSVIWPSVFSIVLLLDAEKQFLSVLCPHLSFSFSLWAQSIQIFFLGFIDTRGCLWLQQVEGYKEVLSSLQRLQASSLLKQAGSGFGEENNSAMEYTRNLSYYLIVL